MGDGLLLLSWKNHGSTFSHVISTLREKGHYTDVTLACDGKFYPAHKIVLSACSQYFEEMLQNTPCKHPIIVLKDISPKELDALLNYMYAGEVSVSQNNLTALIKAAESLHIKGLAVPDELPIGNIGNLRESQGGSLYNTSSNDTRISPPSKRQKRERDNTSPSGRDTQTPLNRSPDSSPLHESESRLSSSYENESRFHIENTSNVKTEVLSVPSSPALQVNEIGEQSISGSALQDALASPTASETRNRSSTNFQRQDSFEPLFEVKEEVLDCDSDGPAHDVSFTPPAVTGATISPTLPAVKVGSSASGATVAASVSGTATLRPPSGDNSFGDHIRSLLFNSPERKDSLHSESSGFHAPGPSGLLGSIGVNVREGYRPGTENYNTSQRSTTAATTHGSSVGPAHIPTGGGGPPRAHPTREACSFQQSRGKDDRNKAAEPQDPLGNAGVRKTYQCPYCPYSSQWQTNYYQHLCTHTGEKQFSCTYCSFRSGRKSVVTKHMKTQHEF